MNRRDFLKLSALSGVGLGLPLLPKPVMASTEPFAGPYVIMVNAIGGWDPTSFCDPKGMQSEMELNPVNTNYFSGDIAMAGNIPYAPIGYNQTFFEKNHQRLLIMNGIDVGTNSLGWCILDLSAKGEPVAIRDIGVRIFPDGRDPKSKASLAVDRRTARSARRRRSRKRVSRPVCSNTPITHGPPNGRA